MPWNRIAILLFSVLIPFGAAAQQPGQQQVQQPSQTNPVANPAPVPGKAPNGTPSIQPTSPLPSVTPANRPVIGLALEGGGALGLAHIGVIEWFEDNHIPIDRIAGTSMGALVGAIYSTGHTPDQMRVLATSGSFTSVFALQTPYVDSSFRRRQDRRQTPAILTFGLKHGPEFRNALLADRGVDEFLTTNLFGYNRKDLDYNDLPIPFRCVVTDLNTFQSLAFSNGPLPLAVRASISIPGVFAPVQDERGHYLADGGILDNLPTGVLRRDLHSDVVIAIRLEDAPLAGSDVSSIAGVINRAFSAGIVNNVEQSLHLADVVVNVPVAKYSTLDYTQGGYLIREGYLAAEANRAVLSRYALNDADWAAYLAARKLRQLRAPGALREVRVEGGAPGAEHEVEADMRPLKGEPISPAATLGALKQVQSNGGYGANYETFSPTAPSPSTPSPATSAASGTAGPDTGIVVHLSQDPTGPPYLLLGPELAAETSNITRMELTTRLVDQNLGGFGSELRATARVGYMTDLSAEYYRLLTPSGFFIEPRTGIVREPVYIWADQKRVAERLLQNLDAGVEAGRTIGYTTQISAEWRAEDTHWSLTTGSGGGPYVSGTAQTGLLHINIDHETSGAISPRGFRLSAAAGALYHAAGSANAPLVQFSSAHTWLWKENNIFGLTGDVDSYLRVNVAQPYRFTLGGPRRLSASSFDEYRGTDTYLARAGYLRRIAPMPAGLGQGLFAVFAYEAGEIWSPEASAILRQDGAAGLLAATPLGSITVGGALGDADHRKLFITIGRLF